MSPTATTFTTSSPETHPSKHVSLAQAKTVALQKELKEERSKAEELQTECDRLRKFKDVFWLRAMNLDYGIRTLFSALNLPLGLLFRSYHYDCAELMDQIKGHVLQSKSLMSGKKELYTLNIEPEAYKK